ncbi:universal stress protein [Chloroflexota bacterium]
MAVKRVGFNNILIPVTGTEADNEAMKLACRLLDKKGKGSICAVCIIAIARTLPLDAEVEPEINKAENILTHMESVAKEQGFGIETDLLQARNISSAIIEEAEERKTDVIIIGVEYHTRFGEFNLGKVVTYVLKNAPCRVIIYHQQAK